MTDSGGNYAQRGLAGAGFQAGVAKDKLIFIIICTAAMLVAAVTLVYFLTGDSEIPTGDWQCLKCAYTFSKKTTEKSPIDCPKCGGDAVRQYYHKCPECGKKVLFCRVQLTKEAQAQRDAMLKQAETAGQKAVLPPEATMSMPMDIQYWAKQPDGSYGWTDWMLPAPPQARQLKSSLQCSECGANLFPQP